MRRTLLFLMPMRQSPASRCDAEGGLASRCDAKGGLAYEPGYVEHREGAREEERRHHHQGLRC